ncbi:phosphoenolpyruvate/phosphate translocator, putative [Plasmodium vinckei lentum]|uniref:Phosphoenolpyruvate/phosphate translocator, putative n=1 Tax=Plasmodium vinckei lentum TaxID=138297 RepID=A0A6V7S1J0_PLAVN|nr:phosphoenolpyruvate/phosphate translocator, putative [Plasmodium vinckei lentum]
MNMLIKSVIIAFVINIQIHIAKCLKHEKNTYFSNSPINFHYNNINEYSKNKNYINANTQKKKNFNKIPLFINNYKTTYEKINRPNENSSNIRDVHKYSVEKRKIVLNAKNNEKNEGKFVLFNNTGKNSTGNYGNRNYGNRNPNDVSNNGARNVGNAMANNTNTNKEANGITKSGILNNIVEGGKTLSLLSLWYVCNILYNIENKKALNLVNLPITLSVLQIYIGLPLFLIPWFLKLKNRPELFYDENEMKRISQSNRNFIIKGFQRYMQFLKKYSSIMKQSIYHGYTHLLSVIAMGAGAISFVHIVKALGPLFAAFFSFALTNTRMSIYTYSSLVPIVVGVSLASIKELSFTYKALYSTLIANVLTTLRTIEAKDLMNKNLEKLGKNLTPENIFSLLTIFSAIFLTPALYMDAHRWKDTYYYLMNNKNVLKVFGKHVLMSGVWFYLYNQLSFISLNRLNHITHAVASTVKRVFLILTSYFIFGTKFSFLGGVGSAMAVSGTFLYSIAKKKFG